MAYVTLGAIVADLDLSSDTQNWFFWIKDPANQRGRIEPSATETRFSKAPETFRARKAIFSPSASKNG